MDPAGVLSLLLLVFAVAGVFTGIPYVSQYVFWVAIAAYVLLDWRWNWTGVLSLLLLGLAIVGVFIEIPWVSNYAFWVAVAAYFIRDWTYAQGPGPLVGLGRSRRWGFRRYPRCEQFRFLGRDRCLSHSCCDAHTTAA